MQYNTSFDRWTKRIESKKRKRKFEKPYNSVTMTCELMTMMTFRVSNNNALSRHKKSVWPFYEILNMFENLNILFVRKFQVSADLIVLYLKQSFQIASLGYRIRFFYTMCILGKLRSNGRHPQYRNHNDKKDHL